MAICRNQWATQDLRIDAVLNNNKKKKKSGYIHKDNRRGMDLW